MTDRLREFLFVAADVCEEEKHPLGPVLRYLATLGEVKGPVQVVYGSTRKHGSRFTTSGLDRAER